MKIIKKSIKIEELEKMSEKMFGSLVKAVIDAEKEIIAVDADLHADEEAWLIEKGSKQENLWGINLYPKLKDKKSFIEFDSIINLRPSLGNKTRGVDDLAVQKKIRKIVGKLVIK